MSDETRNGVVDAADLVKEVTQSVTGAVNEGLEQIRSEQAAASESWTEQHGALTDQVREVTEKVEALAKSMDETRVSLSGTEDVKKKDGTKVRMGDFLLAGGLLAEGKKDIAERFFPEALEISEQCRKVASDATKERYFGEHTAMRTLTTQVDSQGGLFVPEQISGEFIRSTAEITALGSVPSRMITGLTGSPYRVSRHTTRPTAYMVGEAVSLTKSTPAFARESFEPRKCGVLFGQSREQQQFGPEAARIAEESAREVMAEKFDQQFLEGTGGQYQVLGLANVSGTSDYDASSDPDDQSNGRDLTGYHMVRARQKIEEAKENIASFGTVCATKTKNVLAMEGVVAGGASTLDPASSGIGTFNYRLGNLPASDEQLRAAYGPIGHTTQLTETRTKGSSTDVAYTFWGPWALFWRCFWGGMFVQTSNVAVVGSENAFTDDLVFTKLVQLIDAGPVRASAFFISDDFRTVRSGV